MIVLYFNEDKINNVFIMEISEMRFGKKIKIKGLRIVAFYDYVRYKFLFDLCGEELGEVDDSKKEEFI